MAERRGGGEFAVSLDELDDCIADESTGLGEEELGALISEFLYTVSKETRQVFVRRYFYSDSVSAIAKRFKMTESKVKSMLHRTRLSLKDFLTAHDIQI
jgi:RNA polymerase sigma-70 factor (ECF subfamily)